MEHPSWSPEREIELKLLARKLTAGEWRVLQAAALGAAEPDGGRPDLEHLHRQCDAFGFAPLVVRDGTTLRMNVADPSWVVRVLGLESP
jgi:hypothetical protein